MHAPNLRAQRLVAFGPSRAALGVEPARTVRVVGRRGDRQHGADRLDPVLISMLVDEIDHHFGRRSSSA